LQDDGTNDLLVSEVLRTNELQVWFLSEHLVNVPLIEAKEPSMTEGAAYRNGSQHRINLTVIARKVPLWAVPPA
jgi:hypothetical protein